MIRLLRTYLRPYAGQIVLVVALLLIQSIGNLYLPTLNGDIINNGVAKGDNDYIINTGAFMLAVTFALGVASILAVYWGAKTAMGFGRDVRSAIFRKVESFSQVEVNHFGPASLITRNTNDVQQVQMVVFMALTLLIGAPILIIGGIIMAIRQDVPLSGLLVVVLPIMVVFIGIVMYRAIPLFRAMQVKLDRINQVMRETLAGVRVIRAFVRTDHEERRFDDANTDLFETSLQVNRLFAVTIPVMTVILNLSTVAVMWFGALRVDSGEMPIGNLTAFLQYLMQILFSVLMAVFMFVFVPRAAVSAGRIQEVLEQEPSVRDPEHPVRRRPWHPADGARSSSATSSSAIRAPSSRSCATSRSRPDPARPPRSWAAPAAASRPSINLIPRFYDATGGAVLIDGVDVRQMDRDGPLEADRVHPPEGVPVQRDGRQQPAVRRPGGDRRRAVACPRDRPGSRLRRGDGGRPRGADHPGRHERVGRPAPAPGDRPGPGQAGRHRRSSTTASRRSTSAPTRGCGRRSTASSAGPP